MVSICVAHLSIEVMTYPRGQEGQHLVDQLGVGEVAPQHHGSENIGLEILSRCLGFGQGFPLLADNVIAEIAQESGFIGDDLVQSPGHCLGDPLGQGEVHGQEGHLLGGGLEDIEEALGDLVVAVLQGTEVSAHGSRTDDIEREATETSSE